MTRGHLWSSNCTIIKIGWGFAPDPSGWPYSTPTHPLAGFQFIGPSGLRCEWFLFLVFRCWHVCSCGNLKAGDARIVHRQGRRDTGAPGADPGFLNVFVFYRPGHRASFEDGIKPKCAAQTEKCGMQKLQILDTLVTLPAFWGLSQPSTMPHPGLRLGNCPFPFFWDSEKFLKYALDREHDFWTFFSFP